MIHEDMEVRSKKAAPQSQGSQAVVDAELHKLCSTLIKKLDNIKNGRRAIIIEDVKEAVRLLLFGANVEVLHVSFKQNIFEFLCHVPSSFSDVLATQNGISSKNKILMVVLLKLMYYSPPANFQVPTTETKGKQMFDYILNILQRSLLQSSENKDVGLFEEKIFHALNMQSIPRQIILKLPEILSSKSKSMKIEQAGEITKNLCQWLLIYAQNSTSLGKKKPFQNKSSQYVITELDGTASRDIFTVLNCAKHYHKEHILNIYAFSVVKAWIAYAFAQSDSDDLLANAISKAQNRREIYSGSPLSVGTSNFYEDFSSESDSTSIASSLASSPSNVSTLEDLSTDQFSPEKWRKTSRSATPAMLPFRKNQAFDTVSITSDVFSNNSNLKSVTAKYCLRIINQSERAPQNETDRSSITASVVEAIEILDILCKEDSRMTQKVFTEIKRLYKRIEEKPIATRRVFTALVQFYIHHHMDMMVHIDDLLERYFSQIPSNYFTSQWAAFELFELCMNNSQFFQFKTKMAVNYCPNIFKFIAWWPCSVFEEFCDFLKIAVNETTAVEVLHLILDLPSISVGLQLKHKSILNRDEKLEEVLQKPIKPYYRSMFSFILRARSGGAETIDKLSELHDLLSKFEGNTLVRYVADIVPSVLIAFFSLVDQLENNDIYRKLFPILIERTFIFFPRNRQDTVVEIFADKIEFITKTFPDVVNDYVEEILIFLSNIHDEKAFLAVIIRNAIHGIGYGAAHLSADNLQLIYKNLETLIYEALHNLSSKEPQESLSFYPEVLQSMVSTLSKLASQAQEKIPRAIVCLSKIISFESVPLCISDKATEFNILSTYTKELINMLKKPNVAETIFNLTSSSVPWHLNADRSLMMKVHVLSEQVE